MYFNKPHYTDIDFLGRKFSLSRKKKEKPFMRKLNKSQRRGAKGAQEQTRANAQPNEVKWYVPNPMSDVTAFHDSLSKSRDLGGVTPNVAAAFARVRLFFAFCFSFVSVFYSAVGFFQNIGWGKKVAFVGVFFYLLL